MPGRSTVPSLRMWISVRSVREAGSRASAVLNTLALKTRLGSSRTTVSVDKPGAMDDTNVCGTLTKMRRLSICATRNAGIAFVALPDEISDP